MRVALLGDLHVYRLWTWPWHLLSKRILGQTNLWLNRRSKFNLDLLPVLVDKVRRLEPNLVIQLGDLTSTAMVSEFKLAVDYLSPLMGGGGSLFVVPGNHDRYTLLSSIDRRFERYFGEYASSEYPWMKRIRDDLILLALDPTRPTILDASGKLGTHQLLALERMLSELPDDAAVMVACHYPVGSPPGVAPESRNHRLQDIPKLLKLLHDSARDILYIHGHIHQPWCWRMEDFPGIVTLNAGAPAMLDPIHPRGQGFWLLEKGNDSGGVWNLKRYLPAEGSGWEARSVLWPTRPGEIADIS